MRHLSRIVALLTLNSRPVPAAPWENVGKRQVRLDIEILKNGDVICGSVNNWLFSWAQIGNGSDSIVSPPWPPHVGVALSRVRALSELARDSTSVEMIAAGTTGAACPKLRRRCAAEGRFQLSH